MSQRNDSKAVLHVSVLHFNVFSVNIVSSLHRLANDTPRQEVIQWDVEFGNSLTSNDVLSFPTTGLRYFLLDRSEISFSRIIASAFLILSLLWCFNLQPVSHAPFVSLFIKDRIKCDSLGMGIDYVVLKSLGDSIQSKKREHLVYALLYSSESEEHYPA